LDKEKKSKEGLCLPPLSESVGAIHKSCESSTNTGAERGRQRRKVDERATGLLSAKRGKSSKFIGEERSPAIASVNSNPEIIGFGVGKPTTQNQLLTDQGRREGRKIDRFGKITLK